MLRPGGACGLILGLCYGIPTHSRKGVNLVTEKSAVQELVRRVLFQAFLCDNNAQCRSRGDMVHKDWCEFKGLESSFRAKEILGFQFRIGSGFVRIVFDKNLLKSQKTAIETDCQLLDKLKSIGWR